MAKAKKATDQRTCIVTRTVHTREELLRFVVGPDNQLVLDFANSLPGRGIHVLPERKHLERFCSMSGAIGGRLRVRSVVVPKVEALLAHLDRVLNQRLIDGIGLCRRAGALRIGVRELSDLADNGHRPLVLIARDVAEHTRHKVARVVHRHTLDAPFELLDRERIGAVCGRAHVAVLMVTEKKLAKRLRRDVQCWQDCVA
ncbi:MAG: DUF448 domain-containing protein [Magnetococcales bacterium]|nr:DUF448 domain-containing protein [Magnetococcales bacterium]